MAERVLVKKLEEDTIDARDAAMVASALTRTVDQKRVMRGQPAPKPTEMGKTRGKRKASPAGELVPLPAQEPAKPPSSVTKQDTPSVQGAKSA